MRATRRRLSWTPTVTSFKDCCAKLPARDPMVAIRPVWIVKGALRDDKELSFACAPLCSPEVDPFQTGLLMSHIEPRREVGIGLIRSCGLVVRADRATYFTTLEYDSVQNGCSLKHSEMVMFKSGCYGPLFQ